MNEYLYLCETQSRIIEVLEAENDKLRELVRDMWNEMFTVNDLDYTYMVDYKFSDRVRELEIIE
jgi:hypothetical protein